MADLTSGTLEHLANFLEGVENLSHETGVHIQDGIAYAEHDDGSDYLGTLNYRNGVYSVDFR